jgi:hypothetical protein
MREEDRTVRTWMLCLGVAVMACFAAHLLFAADEEPLRAMGTIKSVDAEGGKVVVTVQAEGAEKGADMTFLVTKDTQITIVREAKTIKNLAAGSRVLVLYTKGTDAAGTLTATMIHVRPAARKTE